MVHKIESNKFWNSLFILHQFKIRLCIQVDRQTQFDLSVKRKSTQEYLLIKLITWIDNLLIFVFRDSLFLWNGLKFLKHRKSILWISCWQISTVWSTRRHRHGVDILKTDPASWFPATYYFQSLLDSFHHKISYNSRDRTK